MGTARGRRVAKVKAFQENYGAELKFPEGWGWDGYKPKYLLWVGYGYFLEPHTLNLTYSFDN